MKKLLPLLSLIVLDAVFLILAFIGGFYTRALLVEKTTLNLNVPGLATAPHDYPLVAEVRQLLEQRYINPLPADKTLEYGMARGLVSAVGDQYTVFVEPQSHELEAQALQGEYGGVGVSLVKDQTGAIILSPYLDSPAEKAGLREGDVLLAVDGTPVDAATTLDVATALLRGLVGTETTVRVRHASGEEFTTHITRQAIAIPSLTWKMLDPATQIGLITISRFSDKTPAELQRAADDLQQKGATRYVLDLRENGGGILEAGVKVASAFLNGGVVMYESQRDAPEKIYTAPDSTTPLATAPLAVLVNHNTASAAEIVAGALLDRGRAPLIGSPTYGKGSVQLFYSLSDGSGLHVTAYLWYTPARRKLEQAGLPPTIVVEPVAESDAPLARAVQYLMEGH